MHKLQRVLVRLSDVVLDPESCAREELIKSARSYAKAMTDDYKGVVFNWRETETAGSWAYEYPYRWAESPCNVIFAQDDTENFIATLKNCNEYRRGVINAHLVNLKYDVGTDLETIVAGSLAAENKKNGFDNYLRAPNSLYGLAEMLYDRYNADAEIYNTTETNKTYVSEALLDEIEKRPTNFALVLFDMHF